MAGGIIKCTKCGTLNDSELFYCNVCQFNLRMVYSGPPVEVEKAPGAEKRVDDASDRSRRVAHLKRRHRDAYTDSSALVGVGTFVRVVGVGVGFGFGLGLAVLAVSSGNALNLEPGLRDLLTLLSFLAGAVAGLLVYTYGLLLAAQGQMLQADLDAAVETLPLMSDEDRLQMMGL